MASHESEPIARHFRLFVPTKTPEPNTFTMLPTGGLTLSYFPPGRGGRILRTFLGWAACNVFDTFNPEMGATLARERARRAYAERARKYQIKVRGRERAERLKSLREQVQAFVCLQAMRKHGVLRGWASRIEDWAADHNADVIFVGSSSCVTDTKDLGNDDLGYRYVYQIDPGLTLVGICPDEPITDEIAFPDMPWETSISDIMGQMIGQNPIAPSDIRGYTRERVGFGHPAPHPMATLIVRAHPAIVRVLHETVNDAMPGMLVDLVDSMLTRDLANGE